jgi:hypothetical protein
MSGVLSSTVMRTKGAQTKATFQSSGFPRVGKGVGIPTEHSRAMIAGREGHAKMGSRMRKECAPFWTLRIFPVRRAARVCV